MLRYLLPFLLLTPLAGAAAQATAPASAPTAKVAPAEADELTTLLQLLREQPQNVAFSVYQVTPGQALGAPVLSYRAAEPMPLASSMKIVVLAAYAHAVAQGELDPAEAVTVAEWEQFYVLQDGGAHAQTLEHLEIPADSFGRARDGSRAVTLDTLARAMIQFSDNAATDLLMTRLGRERLSAATQRLGLSGQEPLAPVSGIFSLWDGPQGAALLSAPPEERAELYWAAAAQVAAEPSRRSPWRILAKKGMVDAGLSRSLQNRTFPAGTTADYARLMSGVLGADTGQFSEQELTVLRRHLGWLLEVSPENARVYRAAYMKGGQLEQGVLTQNYAMQPGQGPHATSGYAVSLFFRDLSPEQAEVLGQQLNGLMLRLAFDPAARARVQETLNSLDD